MLKKAVFFIFIFSIYSISAFSQLKSIEFGPFIGRSYYLGEINPKTHWGNDVGSLALGAIFRVNLNERYSLRASYIKSKLKGNDEKTEYLFSNEQRLATFTTKLSEISAGIEFNFLPYKSGFQGKNFTPYLFVGLSYFKYNPNISVEGFINQTITDEGGGNNLAYLFGPGFKFRLSRKLDLGFEWGFRKTTTDLLDGLENRTDNSFETGKPYDNDWFAQTGFTLTYKITNEGPCPAYNF